MTAIEHLIFDRIFDNEDGGEVWWRKFGAARQHRIFRPLPKNYLVWLLLSQPSSWWWSAMLRAEMCASYWSIFCSQIRAHAVNRCYWIWKKTLQDLQMLSPSLFIQGSLWMLRLLFSIVRNVISVSKTLVVSIALWGCSVNVFVIVVLLVRSCLLITRIKYLKGHKSLVLLVEGVL